MIQPFGLLPLLLFKSHPGFQQASWKEGPCPLATWSWGLCQPAFAVAVGVVLMRNLRNSYYYNYLVEKKALVRRVNKFAQCHKVRKWSYEPTPPRLQ